MDTAVIVALIAGLSSSGVMSVVLYLIQRKDKKAEKALQLSVDRLEQMEKRLEKQENAIERLEKALVAQLHTTIYTKCESILTEYADGRRTCLDVDAFRDLSILYGAYADMGGNGTCKIFFEQVKQIPLKQTNRAT